MKKDRRYSQIPTKHKRRRGEQFTASVIRILLLILLGLAVLWVLMELGVLR